ncbi:acyl-homoserine-lactone synthase [Sphingomonas daechungensis]|uniref:acyl-homoserine-lactone synthase n=1 Tax=Sphingomonas daechungensis TaxID=1176646 RepID=UPI0031EE60DE
MKVELVLPEQRLNFAAPLMQMHQDRKRVFVDTLGWKLASACSWLEVDDFDDHRAVYLLVRSLENGDHEGSVRLLPTVGPHMLSDLFGELCAGPVPRGDDCWEISRLVSRPTAIAGTSVVRVHRLLSLALVEFALLNAITRYTLVTEAQRVPALLSVGWPVTPLGLPTPWMGQQLQALQINVSPATLSTMRARLKIGCAVLQAPEPERQAA